MSEIPNQNFERKGSHLIYRKTLRLAEALAGPKFVIEHLNNENIYINNKSIVTPNTYYKIENKGMPLKEYNSIYGDLFIIFDIEYPENINKDYKNYLFKIFNQKRQKITYKEEECNRYDVEISDNLSEEDLKEKYNDSSDEEDNPNVQCAQQ